MMLHPFQAFGAPVATTKPLTKSTERRLRKMSHEYRPSSFNLSVRAQVLCVGNAIVYRAEIAVTLSRTCLLVPSWRNRTVQCWVIALSEAKFLGFCAEVRAILQHPGIARFLTQRRSLWNPIEQFYRRLATILHHAQALRSTFDCQAAAASRMTDSKHAVEMFLDECWRALELVIPVLATRAHLPASLSRETLSLYILLRDLLSFPESLLEADQVYAKAILNLRDVDDLSPTTPPPICCICLDALQPRPAPETPVPATDRQGERLFSVRLPCHHAFHENCIMAWLRQNPTCPECRARADLQRPGPIVPSASVSLGSLQVPGATR